MLDMANELKEQLLEVYRNDIRKKDEIYHTLLGPEKPGRLRTYGIGATTTPVTRASSQTSAEWTKFVDDSLKDKVTQLFDEMKSEIEKNIIHMMEQRLPELIEKYRNFSFNPSLSNDQTPLENLEHVLSEDIQQVHKCTSPHPAEKEIIENEDICEKDDNLPIHDVAENRTSSHGKSNEGVDCIPTVDLPDIPTGTKVMKHVIENMTSSCAKTNEGVCLATRELRSKASGAQRIKNVEVGRKGSQTNYVGEEDGATKRKKRRKSCI